MGDEYYLSCTACSFEQVTDGLEETIKHQQIHEQDYGPEHFVNFEKVDANSLLSTQSSR